MTESIREAQSAKKIIPKEIKGERWNPNNRKNIFAPIKIRINDNPF